MQTRDEIRQQVQDQVRDAVREARDAAREAIRDAQAEREAAQTISGTIQPPDVPPIEVLDMARDATYAFFLTVAFIAVGLPLARAFARWLDRRGQAAPVPPDLSDRLARMEQGIDAVAIEVERISEAQRHQSKLLSEARTPSTAAPPSWASPQREPVPVRSAGKE